MSKKFTNDLKLECIELVTAKGYSTKQVAQDMNVGYSSLQKWVRQYRAEQLGITPKASALTTDQIRIEELEKKLRQAESDNALLKKIGISLLRYGNDQRQQVALKLKKAGFIVRDICRCFSLSRSVFYARTKMKPIRPQQLRLEAAVKHIHQ
ncbi:transposase [Paraglaciecola aquimarina]|uniref:Transposase n=1 Tax=Paraglaciecola algarum TaxID=3050085 RepID=A0ABS9D931_9ALTE|nr:transposase [Paraglaciecola sp. G1-23]MCF2948502.1 transposase [Paraglaciecola sp. G1-23]